jgi:hypothetical protein
MRPSAFRQRTVFYSIESLLHTYIDEGWVAHGFYRRGEAPKVSSSTNVIEWALGWCRAAFVQGFSFFSFQRHLLVQGRYHFNA